MVLDSYDLLSTVVTWKRTGHARSLSIKEKTSEWRDIKFYISTDTGDGKTEERNRSPGYDDPDLSIWKATGARRERGSQGAAVQQIRVADGDQKYFLAVPNVCVIHPFNTVHTSPFPFILNISVLSVCNIVQLTHLSLFLAWFPADCMMGYSSLLIRGPWWSILFHFYIVSLHIYMYTD